MAKKGNTVAEFRREEHVIHDDLTVNDVDIRRRYYAVRDDGKVLVKNQVHFREDAHRKAYWCDWGWKIAHHQPHGSTGAAAVIQQISPQLLSKGFERTK